MYRLNKLMAVSSLVICLAEGGYGITRREGLLDVAGAPPRPAAR